MRKYLIAVALLAAAACGAKKQPAADTTGMSAPAMTPDTTMKDTTKSDTGMAMQKPDSGKGTPKP